MGSCTPGSKEEDRNHGQVPLDRPDQPDLQEQQVKRAPWVQQETQVPQGQLGALDQRVLQELQVQQVQQVQLEVLGQLVIPELRELLVPRVQLAQPEPQEQPGQLGLLVKQGQLGILGILVSRDQLGKRDPPDQLAQPAQLD